jgi:hypothetical protein
MCSNPAKSDGAICDDGNACTKANICESGVCTAGTPVVCSPTNDCHDVGSCDTATGACSNLPKLDGTKCSLGTCLNGACKAPEATVDLSCHFGIASGAPSSRASWLAAIAFLAMVRRRAGHARPKPHSR